MNWDKHGMINKIELFINKYSSLNLILLSIGLMFFYQIAQWLIRRNIDNSGLISDEEKDLNKKKVRDYGRYFFVLLLFLLWFSKLQTIFISLLAFTAAIVIAFKEVIMCVTGGMLIRINKHFNNGDRIEVNGIRGFVIKKTITATKVLELGPEKNSQQTTGNIITLPNSMFLSQAAVNQSYFQNFSIRSFTFTPADQAQYKESETVLLNIANRICQDYLKKASDSISRFCRKEGISVPRADPRIKLLFSDSGTVKLLLKMPVDNKRIGDIEQDLYREYFEWTIQNKPQNSDGNNSDDQSK